MSAHAIQNDFTALNPTTPPKLASASDSTNLNQQDFIQLLVAQVKNQDPSKPLEPSQFMNQLAQFSTVNGVQDLNGSFNSLAGKLSSGQSLQAAGLVGRSVMVSGGEGILNTGSNISGQVDLPQAAGNLTLKIYNVRGEQLRTLSLGGQSEGDVQFQWDGFDDNGVALPPGRYYIEADALIAGNTQAVEVSVETRIDSITLNQDAAGTPSATLLNLESGATVSLNSVQQIK